MPCSVYKVELGGGEIPVLGNEQVISVVGGEQLHCAKLVLYILLVVVLLLLLLLQLLLLLMFSHFLLSS